ncbi:metal ABC transporter permease [Gleimia hominis]|uniref:metal ABC transporter permease n=1 Tax=Gleimia hominis TaxID=595468 RepID=UPI000C80E7C3|nr:metal ABC transporter permease [Gleimia hominis]WIK63815.1 metal ABC transporter permease [Gleimia hominis]
MTWDILFLPVVEVILMGAATGIVGALAVAHSRIFFSESLTHATFPGAIIGVVVAAWIAHSVFATRASYGTLSIMLFVGAILICIPTIWLMRYLARVPGQSSQASAGIILTFGFALGYFLNKWFAPLPLKIDSFLTGSLLHVNTVDVGALAVNLLLLLVVVGFGGRYLTFYSFDPVAYRAAGFHEALAEAVILAAICLTTVTVIPAVGTILPIALIAAPAACLYPHVRSMRTLLWTTPLLGIGIGLVGMAAAVHWNLSAGGTIACLAGIVYLVVTLARDLMKKLHKPTQKHVFA